ncbi:MAG: hypothetical protein Tsb002_00500 [Wenzhouxiangellaceae bacterium]
MTRSSMKGSLAKSNRVYVVDVETTGPDVFKNDVLYIYIAPLFSNQPCLDLFIKYDDRDLSWGSVASKYFKAYSEEWRVNALALEDAWETFVDFVENRIKSDEIILCGHNVGFDYSFLNKFAHLANAGLPKKISHRLFDVHSILFYYNLKGIIPNSALSSLGAIKYFGLDYSSGKRHSAKEDVKATRKIITKLLNFNEINLFDAES